MNVVRYILKLLAFSLLLPASAKSQGGFLMPPGVRQVEWPFDYVNNFIVVTVTLNGTIPLKMIFDTGAEHTVLCRRELSDLLGIRYDREFRLLGADMKTELTAYLARNVRLDAMNVPLAAPDEDILVLQEDYFRFESYAGIDIHGILAANTLSDYLVRINYLQKTITVSKHGVFSPERAGFSPFPAELYRKKLYLRANLGFVTDSLPNAKLLLDTGAALPLLLISSDSTMKLPQSVLPGQIGMGLGGDLQGYIGRVQDVSIGKYRQSGVISYFQMADSMLNTSFTNGRTGIAGNVLLNRFQVVLDYHNSVVWLKPSGNFRKKYVYDRSGIYLLASGNSLNEFVVESVMNNSPASEAGILPGDQIVRVGLAPARILQLQNVLKVLQKKPGNKVRLLIFRNGVKIRKTLLLRNLI
ncbi:MAG: PDZ domain-containing protein [Saprospiraceae bacterium]|nr:PDZ domain-containing protein [Saprospiraceae bacterium]